MRRDFFQTAHNPKVEFQAPSGLSGDDSNSPRHLLPDSDTIAKKTYFMPNPTTLADVLNVAPANQTAIIPTEPMPLTRTVYASARLLDQISRGVFPKCI